MEPADPGMHTTATVDFEVVVSGQATLELDDGAKVTLEVGDTCVQNGTRHRWSNSGVGAGRARRPARVVWTVIGAITASFGIALLIGVVRHRRHAERDQD